MYGVPPSDVEHKKNKTHNREDMSKVSQLNEILIIVVPRPIQVVRLSRLQYESN